ncbi:MAG: ABC transporter permease [Pirellula sp.]
MSTGWLRLDLHLMNKEMRQAFPLIGILALLGLLLHFIGVLTPNVGRSMSVQILFGMPLFFAVGAGALLVGQEKEQRTLNWLRVIPIPHRQIIRTKLMAAIAALLVVWGISLAMFAAVAWQRGEFGTRLGPGIAGALNTTDPTGVLYSLFVLLCGIAISWRFHSTFVSLILIVPLAFLPAGLIQVIEFFRNEHLSNGISIGCLMVGIVVVAVYGWYAGVRGLAPARAHPRESRVFLGSLSKTLAIDWLKRKPQTQSQALSRQFTMQNALALDILTNVILVGSVYVAWQIRVQLLGPNGPPNSIENVPSINAVGGFVAVAVCWLGVVSFQGDRLNQRIRFCADRGVEPTQVWRTRHAVPFCILTCVGLVLLCWLYWLNPFALTEWDVRWFGSLGVFLSYTFVLFGIYALSQWVGQAIQSPVVSAIVAPAFASLVIGYLGFALVELEAPIWLTLITLSFPWIATWMGMKRWMDGQTGIRFWLAHAGWLAMLFVLPAIPFFVGLWQIPRMPTELRNELLRVYHEPMPFVATAGAGRYEPDHRADTDITTAGALDGQKRAVDPVSVREFILLNQTFIASQFERNQTSDLNSLKNMWNDLMLLRLESESRPDPAVTQAYRKSFSLALRVAESLRAGKNLESQSYSEATEVMLVRQLKKPNTELLLGGELFDKSIRFVANSTQRDQARRKALANDWKRGVAGKKFLQLGAYNVESRPRGSNLRNYLSQRLMIDERVMHLWAMLEAKNKQAIHQASETVRDDWNGLSNAVNESAQETMEYVLRGLMYPGAFWRGQWEQQAVELMAELGKAKAGSLR